MEESAARESAATGSGSGPSVAEQPTVQEAEPSVPEEYPALVEFEFEPNDDFAQIEEELEDDDGLPPSYEEVQLETALRAAPRRAAEEAVPPATPRLQPFIFHNYDLSNIESALGEGRFDYADDDLTLSGETLVGRDDDHSLSSLEELGERGSASAASGQPAWANFVFGTAPTLTGLDPEAGVFFRQLHSGGYAQYGVERRTNGMAEHIADHYFCRRHYDAAPPFTALPRAGELLLEQQLGGHATARGGPVARPPAYTRDPSGASVFHSIAKRAGASVKAVTVLLTSKRRRAMR